MEEIIDCSKYNNREGFYCYRNSILAILQSLPIVADHLVDKEVFQEFYDRCVKENKDVIPTITYQLFKLFNLSLDNPDANLNPNSFTSVMIKKNSMWGQREQQDSCEFLLDLIDGLREEAGRPMYFVGGRNLIKNEEKKEDSNDPSKDLMELVIKQKEEEFASEKYKFLTNMYSPYNMMFNFMMETSKLCPCCNFISYSIESMNMMKLDLPNGNKEETLENLFKNYNKKERLDDDNRFTCPSCINKVKSIVSRRIMNLPQVLIVNLKRFNIFSNSRFQMKKNNRIIYPVDLDLTEIISDGNTYEYQLVAVNMHLGYGINSGHYISYVKLTSNDKWYEFNDASSVIEVTDVNKLVNRNATILFYLRKN